MVVESGNLRDDKVKWINLFLYICHDFGATGQFGCLETFIIL